ncbi:MAG: excinuclease ABC subunit UvrC [Alphaproteobacteria bacterium]|nr:excinuclease ABC subunit UvrC [Alphaproteobacteria bacterium]
MSDIDSSLSDQPATTVLEGSDLIADHVKRLPGKPGVYRMMDGDGVVLYVGKAKNLRNRVSSYAQGRGHSNRIMRMIAETREMEFVVTSTETEALLLEANLIKKLKPRYNVILRDDKSFPYILIASDHDAPQVLKHRGARKRKGDYFGPFASAGAVNRTLNTLQKAFLLRSCSDSVYDARTRPCLLHQIKRCAAPCVGLVSPAQYGELVAEARAFLAGDGGVQKALSKEMEMAAAGLDFERAAGLRDRIRALTYIQGSQDINADDLPEADIFAIHKDGGQACVQVFFFRVGQNWGNHAYFPRHDRDDEVDVILGAFMAQFYDGRDVPRLILASDPPAQCDLLAEALTLKASRKVEIRTPERGPKKDIVDAASLNAREALARRMSESATQARNLRRLAEVLGMHAPPGRIEVYDNSHISGANAIGAMVVAGPEGLEKSQYRKFNIRSTDIAPGDDFGMMREVLRRRLARLQQSDDAAARPDLIILDGGKGQLSAALDVAAEAGIDPDTDGIRFMAVAKGRREDGKGGKRVDRTMGAVGEQVVMPGRQPFVLAPNDPALFFIQRLRDEAHRFAIGAHRAKRKKAIAANPLDDIPGVGAARKRALLHHFGSAKAVARAKAQDLAAVDGVSEALAQRIYDYFHG